MEEQQAEQTPYEITKIRIYGVPVQRIHDFDQGPLVEADEAYPFYGIVYCGFKTAFNEIRQPTDRLWYFAKADVENSGEVDDFEWEGQRVNYYDVDLNLRIYEKSFQEVHLPNEAAQVRTFVRHVAVQPQLTVDIESIRSMSQEQLEEHVAGLIESQLQSSVARRPVGGRPTATLRNTFKVTRHDPFAARDHAGTDADQQFAT